MIGAPAATSRESRIICADLLAACRAKALSGAELIPTLFSRDISDPHQTMFAMGEVIAHLNHLLTTGRLECREDNGVVRHQTRT